MLCSKLSSNWYDFESTWQLGWLHMQKMEYRRWNAEDGKYKRCLVCEIPLVRAVRTYSVSQVIKYLVLWQLMFAVNTIGDVCWILLRSPNMISILFLLIFSPFDDVFSPTPNASLTPTSVYNETERRSTVSGGTAKKHLRPTILLNDFWDIQGPSSTEHVPHPAEYPAVTSGR